MTRLTSPVQLATIGAAHGIRGEVRVKTYTDNPLSIGDYGTLYDKNGREYEVLEIRPSKNVVIVRFRGVNDRNMAESLNGTDLFIDRSQLPEELEDDEFYHTDLIGLAAIGTDGTSYGVVKAVFDFGGGHLIELGNKGRKSHMIPFTVAAVPEIDLDEGKIIVEPYAAGLIEDSDDEPQDGKPATKKSDRPSDEDSN